MKRMWILLALLLIVPGLLFTVSCAKKQVSDTGTIQPADTKDTSAEDDAAKQAELDRQKEAERQRQLEEERLNAEKMQTEEAKRAAAAAKNMFINENVSFDFDSAALSYQAQELLKRKADWMRTNPYVTVSIEGHCDERGTTAYNLALGERRAESAKGFLVDLGIAASRMTTISYGEERPLDSAQNEEAWAKNRRAHFEVE